MNVGCCNLPLNTPNKSCNPISPLFPRIWQLLLGTRWKEVGKSKLILMMPSFGSLIGHVPNIMFVNHKSCYHFVLIPPGGRRSWGVFAKHFSFLEASTWVFGFGWGITAERRPDGVTSCACTFHGHCFRVLNQCLYTRWSLRHVAGAAGIIHPPFTKQKPMMPGELGCVEVGLALA